MAALGKIRSKGTLLLIVVGIALLAFVGGDILTNMERYTGSQNVGEIYGEDLSAQDYQAMVEEQDVVLKLTQGITNLTEDQSIYIKDQVWQTYCQYKLIEHEADKLGLTVSDAEMQNILTEGTHQLLRQTPFLNQQTGLFDKDQLQRFLTEYSSMDRTQVPPEQIEAYDDYYKFWMYIEKTLRQQRLIEKYQGLMLNSAFANKLETEASFAARTNSADLLFAAIPYTSIADSAVNVTDADLQKLYDKKKELYRKQAETRDIKYIAVQVKASDKDRADIEKTVKAGETALQAGSDYSEILKDAGSEMEFSNLFVTKDIFATDVAAKVEAATAGEVIPTFYNTQDNAFYTIKLLATTQEADSVKFRQIPVQRATEEETNKLADSIMTALTSGSATFDTLAVKYNGMREGQWISTKNYENQPVIDETTEKLFTAIFSGSVGGYQTIDIPNGKLILQVQEKKSPVTKYRVAAVKRTLTFSKETYNAAYNKFSTFLASNTTIDLLSKNAEQSEYRLIDNPEFASSSYQIGGIRGTHEALRWVFDAKVGQVSQLYECGENDYLFVVALTGIDDDDYMPFAKVKEMLRPEALRDKKAEQIIAEINKAKPATIADAQKLAGAVTDTLRQVSFANAAFVSATSSSEPAVSGYIPNVQLGKLSAPVKGNAAVFLLQPIKQNKAEEQYNIMTEKQTVQSQASQSLSGFMRTLYMNAKIKDNRYIYF